MRGKTPLSILLRGFFLIVICVLIAIGVVAGIGWWSGWTEQIAFQRAIQLAGLVLIGLGFLWIRGKQNVEIQNNSSAVEVKDWGETLGRLVQRYGYMLVLFIAGGVCLLIGWLM